MDGRPIELDVVPLFETGEDLLNSVDVLEQALQLTRVRHRLTANDRRFEVMLGYSDSAKDVGPVSATLALYDAQARITAWAQRNNVRLTLFHGRGGALGRGGGPANRAVLAQAPGSVGGRFKLTEQGEAIPARYGDAAIAHRHIEQVAAATLLASTPAVEERAAKAAERFAEVAATLDGAAREAYHRLVRADGFAEWFGRVTPLEELGQLPIGSRPARRGVSVSSLEDLRAIPWVFAWSQARINAPGWYGLGSALAAVGDVRVLQDANRDWPLFQVMLENAEMSLAKTDRRILCRYLELGDRPELAALVLERARAHHRLGAAGPRPEPPAGRPPRPRPRRRAAQPVRRRAELPPAAGVAHPADRRVPRRRPGGTHPPAAPPHRLRRRRRPPEHRLTGSRASG